MSEFTSTPKAPKPRHHRTHRVLRMSSPELAKHAARRQHKSSTTKRRSASVDSVCDVPNCRHCSRARSPSPAPTYRFDHSMQPRERTGKAKRSVPAKKVSKPSTNRIHVAAKKTTHRRSRHDVRPRGRSQVRDSSARPPTRASIQATSRLPSSYNGSSRASLSSVDYFYRRRATSRRPSHIRTSREAYYARQSEKAAHRGRKTHRHTSNSRENRSTRPSSTQEERARYISSYKRGNHHRRRSNQTASPARSIRTGSPRSLDSIARTTYGSALQSPMSSAYSLVPSHFSGDGSVVGSSSSYERSPSASPPTSRASSVGSWKTETSSASIPWATLEKHAHCRKSKCALRQQLDAKLSPKSRHKSPSPALSTIQRSPQTTPPPRPPHCTCPINVTSSGQTVPLNHERPPEDFKSPFFTFQKNVDTNDTVMLWDPVKGYSYNFSSIDPSNPTALKIEAHDEFEPTAFGGLGFHCPCYDEVHGAGAAVRLIYDLTELYRQGHVMHAFKEGLIKKFPWMDKKAAEERAQQNISWLGEQYVAFCAKWGVRPVEDETRVGAQLLDQSGLL